MYQLNLYMFQVELQAQTAWFWSSTDHKYFFTFPAFLGLYYECSTFLV